MRSYAICLVVLTVGIVFASTVGAEVPQLINYQGMLTDLSGAPINGTHDLTFKIYAGSDPGLSALWTEVHSGIFINQGLFSVIIGGTEPFPADLFFGGERWVGITVDSDAEISPRTKLVSVPWALRATKADTAGTVDNVLETDPEVGVNSLGYVPKWDGSALVSGMIFDRGDAVGIRTSNPLATFHLGNGSFLISGGSAQGSSARFTVDAGASTGHTLLCLRTNAGVQMYVHGGRVGIGTDAPGCELDVNGYTRTHVLEITGGSDLAEPFPVHDTTSMKPGMVVSIDSCGPGDLIVSSQPYDHKVAGVIAGANDLRPGMVMADSDNQHSGPAVNVALTGRVWCWADASNGPITPGDLLTTSGTPGHAMKATEYARAQGAILGKAMSSLESGRGLVLVLVNLQ